MQQESSSSSGIFKLLDPASSSASIAGAGPSADAANNGTGAAPEQDRRKRNLNYRFHFLESDEDDMLSAGSSVTADRSTGAAASGVDDNTQSSAAAGKFGRYREDNNCIKF